MGKSRQWEIREVVYRTLLFQSYEKAWRARMPLQLLVAGGCAASRPMLAPTLEIEPKRKLHFARLRQQACVIAELGSRLLQ